jgi:hypothetical protein
MQGSDKTFGCHTRHCLVLLAWSPVSWWAKLEWSYGPWAWWGDSDRQSCWLVVTAWPGTE